MLMWFVGVVCLGFWCGWPLRGVIVLLSNWPLRGVIVLLSSVYDDAGIGKEFACSEVGVVCWGCRCGNFTESGEMSRVVMILNFAE